MKNSLPVRYAQRCLAFYRGFGGHADGRVVVFVEGVSTVHAFGDDARLLARGLGRLGVPDLDGRFFVWRGGSPEQEFVPYVRLDLGVPAVARAARDCLAALADESRVVVVNTI